MLLAAVVAVVILIISSIHASVWSGPCKRPKCAVFIICYLWHRFILSRWHLFTAIKQSNGCNICSTAPPITRSLYLYTYIHLYFPSNIKYYSNSEFLNDAPQIYETETKYYTICHKRKFMESFIKYFMISTTLQLQWREVARQRYSKRLKSSCLWTFLTQRFPIHAHTYTQPWTL